MVKIKRPLPVFVAFILAFAAWSLGAQPLPLAKPEEVGMSSQRLAKISQALKKEVDDGSFRGAVVMVARKGKLVYQDSIGMQTASTKMTRDSIFRIYSMTKPLVSVAAMMLVEDGTIQLTDPVSKYLPGFDKLQVSVPAKNDAGATTYSLVPQERQMTVQDLLRHTSGLAYGEITQNAPVKDGYEKIGVYYKDHDFDSRNLAPADQVAKMASVPLAYQPGTTWHYSLASDMLRRVVERASGKRLGDLLQERLFARLKMVDSGFWVPASKMPRVAESLEKDRFAGRGFPLVDVSSQPMNDSGGAPPESFIGCDDTSTSGKPRPAKRSFSSDSATRGIFDAGTQKPESTILSRANRRSCSKSPRRLPEARSTTRRSMSEARL